MTNETHDGLLSDIVITRGPGFDRRLQSYDKFVLFHEDLCLLAAPSFVRSARVSKVRDVLRQQIVRSVTRPTSWPGWLSQAGFRGEHIRFRHVFDHLFIAMHRVRDRIGTIVAPGTSSTPAGAPPLPAFVLCFRISIFGGHPMSSTIALPTEV